MGTVTVCDDGQCGQCYRCQLNTFQEEIQKQRVLVPEKLLVFLRVVKRLSKQVSDLEAELRDAMDILYEVDAELDEVVEGISQLSAVVTGRESA